ncbi:hypothetical protein PTKIN_Ptkin08bG0005000 [Pterospermum kingtungense]
MVVFPNWQEDGVDLVMTIKGANFYRRGKQLDFGSDYIPPTPFEFKKLYESHKWILTATSPVMLSTLENGKVVRGLAGIPSEGPVLYVGYHMLMAIEVVPFIAQLMIERAIPMRALAHPTMFVRVNDSRFPDPSMFDAARIMGTVPVSATNFCRLLSSKSHVLLYPDGQSRLKPDANGEVANQQIYTPWMVPKFPGRFYFYFGKPIETEGMKLELRDKDKSQQLYLHVKSEVEKCLAFLTENREKDPFRNLLPRLLYHASLGSSTASVSEIPTFEL